MMAESQNCWEFEKCDIEVRKKCPAYKNNSGRDCWMIAGSHNKSPYCPKLKNKITNCWECQWFKKINPKFEK
jgi:hypothetical protein